MQYNMETYTIPFYQVDAFTDTLFKGNPAVVSLLKEWLPDETLQNIAFENNQSETSFIVQEGKELRIRWFTPGEEVNLCGHATLAAAKVIFENSEELTRIEFNSKSGKLTVTQEGDLMVMDFPRIDSEKVETPEALKEWLGTENIKECVFSEEQDFMAILKSAEDVKAFKPDYDILKALPGRGFTITAEYGKDGIDFISQFFVPKVDLGEDPVTGSAHCQLTPYWANILRPEWDGKSPISLTGEQCSRRGGIVTCELNGDRVKLKGQAVIYSMGSITIPKGI